MRCRKTTDVVGEPVAVVVIKLRNTNRQVVDAGRKDAMTILYETNIDDMDPRLVPHVIDALLAAGARDAWAVPILMKKGRPGFMISTLCDEATAPAVRRVLFHETTTIGIREVPIRRHVLDRDETQVEIEGQPIGVKRAYDAGALVNTSIEWDDVVAAAEVLGRPAKDVLEAATAAARLLVPAAPEQP